MRDTDRWHMPSGVLTTDTSSLSSHCYVFLKRFSYNHAYVTGSWAVHCTLARSCNATFAIWRVTGNLLTGFPVSDMSLSNSMTGFPLTFSYLVMWRKHTRGATSSRTSWCWCLMNNSVDGSVLLCSLLITHAAFCSLQHRGGVTGAVTAVFLNYFWSK